MATQLSGYRKIALRRKGAHVAKWTTAAQALRPVSARYGRRGSFIGVLLPPRANGRGCAMLAWIDRTNDGLSGMPADGTSLPAKKGLRHIPLGRLGV